MREVQARGTRLTDAEGPPKTVELEAMVFDEDVSGERGDFKAIVVRSVKRYAIDEKEASSRNVLLETLLVGGQADRDDAGDDDTRPRSVHLPARLEEERPHAPDAPDRESTQASPSAWHRAQGRCCWSH